jgi:hypothetical protein
MQGFPRDLQRSSLDIPLPAGTGDDEYMGILEGTLPMLIHEHQPDLIMYNAGEWVGGWPSAALRLMGSTAASMTTHTVSYSIMHTQILGRKRDVCKQAGVRLMPNTQHKLNPSCCAGVDVHADDSLGHLNLSLDGIAR